ncbi:glycerophosphodiester phosphodiesterase family protein [Paenibacillus sp. JCM 10914]|uniref:glycerophosphodiester phosphodiesterase n=1 Tax=Paenibacillus sp. JCM 10914 TaxID=1236974 RepID=UPI0003CC90EE|nr:glycerophosphodiester phosphodiesterase family protein [Paenibacillus sp. JCM 10914]GAE04064.1 glycerophosphoryl diester phosphodiesterase [Paenibacillus sp. JCM 10914]
MKKAVAFITMMAWFALLGYRASEDTAHYPYQTRIEVSDTGNGNWIHIAHRGASGYAPENTLAAFAKADEMGADMLELDVQRSSDGQLVVIHDMTVDRTSNGKGKVGNMTLSELRRLDVGSWYSADFKDEVIPTLQEVLMRFGERTGLLIELKSPEFYPGIEQDLVACLQLHSQLHAVDRHSSLIPPVIVQSANADSLQRLHKLMPEIPLGIVITSSSQLSKLRMNEVCTYADYVNISMRLVSRGLIQKIHQSGMKSFIWTIRDMHQIPYLLHMKADGIITDYPDRVPVL